MEKDIDLIELFIKLFPEKSSPEPIPEKIARSSVKENYLLSREERLIKVRLVREDLLLMLKKINNKLSQKLSRKMKIRDKVMMIYCSPCHFEKVQNRVCEILEAIVVCSNCKERDTKYLKNNFYCEACGFIVSSKIKFKKIN